MSNSGEFNTTAAFLAQAHADAERDIVAVSHMSPEQIQHLVNLGGEPDPLSDGLGCDHELPDEEDE